MSLLLAISVVQQLAHGPMTVPAPAAPAPGVARATRVETVPQVDGRLDDAAWSGAIALGGFRQRDPQWGAAPSESTTARVLYSDDALYVGIRAWDSRAGEIRGLLTRRDAGSPSDWVSVSIDAQHDRRSAYTFAVNAAGVQLDAFRFNDIEEDLTWNAVWESRVTRDSLGWSAELRIPFSQLRMPPGERHRFGLQLFRRIPRTSEWLWWKVSGVGEAGIVSAYGDLDGIEGIRPRRPLEITPYVLAGAERPVAQAGDPFSEAGGTHSMGADLRAGLPGNLSLTAAINPDFGQVEADPAVVNLSASETFLPERRPFFAEGADLFRLSLAHATWSSEALFYSRRVGRAPQLDADARGGYADDIASTTILGAGKITGRVAPGWTLGLLTALTAEEEAAVRDSAGAAHRDIVEPRTVYTVGRLARELRGGQTVIGLFGTAVARDLPDGMTSLRSSAHTLGTSVEHRFGGDRWHVTGQLVGSRVAGSSDAILRTQRSSVRYYQRPDDGIAVDSSRTSLAGTAGTFEFARRAGSWTGALRFVFRSPGFETNDAGFQTWAGQRYGRASLTRRWLTPTRWFNRAEVTVAHNSMHLWNGHRAMGATELATVFVTRSNWTLRNTIWARYGGRDPTMLRGGPALTVQRNIYAEQLVDSDPSKRVSFGLGLGGWRYHDGYYGAWGQARVFWRPSSGVELSLAPRFDAYTSARGWVTRATIAGADVYVIGQQNFLLTAMGLRANVTLSPTMSFEAFAEPFVSRGRFESYKTVRDPHSRSESERFTPVAEDQLLRSGDEVSLDLDRDGTADADLGTPDFTVMSLRSNVVLRWEYRPASAIFLVWQHGREQESTRALGTGDGFSRLTGMDSANSLLLKVSYWLRVR